MRGETKVLDEATRRSADGAFIQLPNGITHYQLSNPDSDHTVVLVHGFSVPYFIYDPTFAFLTQSDCRVLRYDLFGRGFSDRPHAQYNLDFFVKQLGDLLDALRFTAPVSLIGLSMGGPIAAAFAAQHPHRVDRLILIDPAGARPITLSPLLKLAKLPLVAEAALAILGGDFLVNSAAEDFFDPTLVAHFQARYKVQMLYKGFGRAILSTVRNNMLGSFIEVYRRLGEMNLPVLLLWGRDDRTVPFEHSGILCEAMPQAEFHVIEHCGHIPHYEKPDDVNPILVKFLRQA
jgi:pimeloyl-ACP methyl ester carboxylesterase